MEITANEKLFDKLCSIAAHEPVEWDRFDELLKSVENMNDSTMY